MKSTWFAAAIRLPFFIGMWLLVGTIKLVLSLLGLIVVPIALRFANYGKLPRWAWLWDNDRDGLEGPDWYRLRYAPNHWLAKSFPRFWWLAVRNPCNNLRFVEALDLDIRPIRVRYVGSKVEMIPKNARNNGTIGFIAWQGIKAGVWVIHAYSEETVARVNYWLEKLTFGAVKMPPGPRHFRFRFGWKIMPADTVAVESWREDGAGFAGQLMLYRKG